MKKILFRIVGVVAVAILGIILCILGLIGTLLDAYGYFKKKK